MNDRIYTLATRAWMNDKGSNRDPIIPREFIDKFAESIVKECANVCYRIDGEYDGEDIMATWCAEGILKHFGVKE
jgi:hypothetical protein